MLGELVNETEESQQIPSQFNSCRHIITKQSHNADPVEENEYRSVNLERCFETFVVKISLFSTNI